MFTNIYMLKEVKSFYSAKSAGFRIKGFDFEF